MRSLTVVHIIGPLEPLSQTAIPGYHIFPLIVYCCCEFESLGWDGETESTEKMNNDQIPPPPLFSASSSLHENPPSTSNLRL